MRTKAVFAQKGGFLTFIQEKNMNFDAKFTIFVPPLIQLMFNNQKFKQMKKVAFLLAILLVGGMMLTGCKKDNPNAKGLYSYTVKEKINTETDDVTALRPFVKQKLDLGMREMTKAEAQAEWNAFDKSIANVFVEIRGAESYYVVLLNRVESQGETIVAVENIGKHAWGNPPAE